MSEPSDASSPWRKIGCLAAGTLLGKAYLSLFLIDELPLFRLVPEDPADVAISLSLFVLVVALVYADAGLPLAFFVLSVPVFDLYLAMFYPPHDISYGGIAPLLRTAAFAALVAFGFTTVQQVGRYLVRRGGPIGG